MYVSLPFTNDSAISVNLMSSAPGVLAVPTTVTIPARATYVYFYVTGAATGSATVTASAPGKAKSVTSPGIPVGTPRLQLFFTANANVGQKNTLTVHAEDSLGVARNLTVPLTVTLTSSNATATTFDSSSITIPANSYYATTGISFTQAGSFTINGSAPGYPAASVLSNATGALVLMQPGDVFAPLTVTISAGQTVLWQNTSTVQHTTTSDAPAWNATLNPGQAYIRTFSTATGSPFTYHCTIHPTMVGTVVVTP
jgi:plastocyanin